MNVTELYRTSEKNPVLIFDGLCHLCNRSVQFVLKKDTQAKFRFCTIQSAYKIIQFQAYADSVVLLDRGNLYVRSKAVIRSMYHLGGIYRLISILFSIIPTVFADYAYGVIAKYRYRWLGKYDSCVVPDGKWNDRFINLSY